MIENLITPEEGRWVADAAIEAQIAGWPKWTKKVGRFVKKAGRVAKKIVKSPVVKAVAGGLAIVIPPVGVAATAALVTADGIIRAAESADATRRKAAQQIVRNTTRAAKRGNKGAQRGLGVLVIAKRMRIARRAVAKRVVRKLRATQRRRKARKRAAVVQAEQSRRKARERAEQSRRKARERVAVHTGVLIAPDGRAIRGRWRRRAPGPARRGELVVLPAGQVLKGQWVRV